ncbi:MAG: hypothetical protein VW270_16055 [Candidatus Poseidoniales archaeon]|jgi:hypothetical protein
MAVSSLTRMTVPLASDQSNPTQGLLMPKLKYRFRVIFENLGVSTPRSELTKQVMDFTRPNLSFQPIDIPIYNSTLKLAGKHEWQDVTCTLRDDAGGEVAKLIGEQLQKQLDFVEQASAASGIDYKFISRCEILDGGNGASTPTVLETWELYGCYLSAVDYGSLDYTANDPVTMALTIRYDNALQTPIGSGVGATVGRTVGDVITG